MLCLLLFLISFMTGLIPPDTIARAELSGVGKWGTTFIVFHMGTMINLKQLAAEWRTVVTAVFAAIIPSLAGIKPYDLVTLSYALVILFAVALVVLFLCFYILPLWKIAGSRNLAMGISVTQMMGFPATYLVALEVAQAAAETEEERKVIMDAIMPKYLVGGLSTVISLSVIMAGILENVL